MQECRECVKTAASMIGVWTKCHACNAVITTVDAAIEGGKVVTHRGSITDGVILGEKRAARLPRVRKTEPVDRVPEFVRDVLRWGLQVSRVETAARGSASPLAGMLARVELYGHGSDGRKIEGARIGSGVRGTKGASEGGGHDEPDPIHVDPVAQARYDAVRAIHRTTIDAVVEDGAGEMLVERFFGPRAYVLALSQRLAFKVAPHTRVGTWARKLAEGDPMPALEGSRRFGDDALESAAIAWWRALA